MWTPLISLAAKVGLSLIDFLIKDKIERDRRKKKMLEFIRRFDESIVEDSRLRGEYDELLKKARAKRKS